jgi:signal transduction histidine kinase
VTRRLLAVFVGLTLLVLAVHDLPLAAHLRDVERDRLVTSLERDAFTLAGIAEEDIEALVNGESDDRTFLVELARRYGERSRSAVFVTDRDAIVIASSEGSAARAGDDASTRAEIRLALSGVRSAGTRREGSAGVSLLYVAVPVLSGPETMGAVEFASPAGEVGARVSRRLRGILIAALVSVLAAAAIGFLLARTLSQPLRRLRRATRSIARGELATRVTVDTGPPEIRALADDFNTMVDRLERIVAEQQSFAGDASHQLRTPLTTVRLRIDQVLDRAGAESTDRAPLESARRELLRLERLVDGLLALARAADSDAQVTVVDVGRVVGERVDAWEALATESDVSMTVELEPGLRVRAVDGALDQIIDNYLANALESSPRGSRIVLRAGRRRDDVEITVLDEGPGLERGDLDRAFDRFWRSPDAPPGGSGVGLAVVRRLAEASRGHVELRARAPHGVAAVVTMPAADQNG